MKGRTNKLRRGSSQAVHRAAARSLLMLEASPIGKGGLDCKSTITISVPRFWRVDLHKNTCTVRIFKFNYFTTMWLTRNLNQP